MLNIDKDEENVLSKKQLSNILVKMASESSVEKYSSADTFPVDDIKEDLKFINLVIDLLNKHMKLRIQIHPAGEWLLDNYYLIEKIEKNIEKILTFKNYIKLPGEKNGYARVFLLARKIVENSINLISEEDLIDFLNEYQTQRYLTMNEIWNLALFLQICVIREIRKECDKIFVSQVGKAKAYNIIQRIIKNKSVKRINYKIESNYSFIENLSYELKKYGGKYKNYIDALSNEILKRGISLEDIVKREHFSVSSQVVKIKNCILNLKRLERMDMLNIFLKTNIVERILRMDPAQVYTKMDYSTQSVYRAKIQEISDQTEISEIYIANKLYNIASEKDPKSKEGHIGFYLIDDGYRDLLERVTNKKIRKVTNNAKAKLYALAVFLMSNIITILLGLKLGFYSILLFVPISNAVTKIVQYCLSKKVKTKILPKMDYSEGIPESATTMCVVPMIINKEEDIVKKFKDLESFYLSNKSENLFFTLLGDCKSSKVEKIELDDEIIRVGKECSENLNQKYGEKFFFVYRKREWLESEASFMGWERKRGLLLEFNKYLKTGYSNFAFNNCPELFVKYIITVDEDTNLCLNTVSQMVGTIDHILNRPVVDKVKNIVVRGHGIIQPRIGIDLESVHKTGFSKLFAGQGGTDLYSNAVSDVYQDCFEEGIYTGKGIYDLDSFYSVLNDTIPENKVLSHDLLEGSFMRCGLASDIVLLDNYPSSYASYRKRKNRWIRGDIQVLPWLKSNLNFLSKYKIQDNILRNSNEIFLFLATFVAIVTTNFSNILVALLLYAIPTILEYYCYYFDSDDNEFKPQLYSYKMGKCGHIFKKFIINFLILPDEAIVEFTSICQALYRMIFSHKKMLEWTTAKEADLNQNHYAKYYNEKMCFQYIAAILLLVILFFKPGIELWLLIMYFAIITLWLIAPLCMYKISHQKQKQNILSENNKNYLVNLGSKTWLYIKDSLINYLPSDNFQQDRTIQWTKRTSPTNIGLALISAISAYDMGYEKKETIIELLKNMITSIEKLKKWNGHLFNWYDVENFQPVYPYEVSTVDSGNFVGYLYVVREFFKNENEFYAYEKVNDLIKNTNFEKLYDKKMGLFSIGYKTIEGKLIDSYYDMLASESRQASIVAIAQRQIPLKHWKNLSRNITRVDRHVGLTSWGGTMFEYLMPNLIIPTYEGSLIDESCKLLVDANRKYVRDLKIPWGISEAAFSQKDLYGNYQYKTFGVPWLGLKRGLNEEIVVSPYSTALALDQYIDESILNLRELESYGAKGVYGFYDSIDFKPDKHIVKTYMAHHQGMILCAINNVINNRILQKRFMNNPEMMGIKPILEEKVQTKIILTKLKKESGSKNETDNYIKYPDRKHGVNVLSTQELSSFYAENGDNYIKYEDVIVNKNSNIFIKNVTNNKVYDLNNCDNEINFGIEKNEENFDLEEIKVKVKTTIAPERTIVIKEIELKNMSNKDNLLETVFYSEPQLSTKEQFEAHPAFDKMFLNFELNSNLCVISRRKRDEKEKSVFEAITVLNDDSGIEFENNMERFKHRGEKIPYTVRNSIAFNNNLGITVNPMLAMRTKINLKAEQSKRIYVLISVGRNKEDAIKNIEDYKNKEKLELVYELSKAQTEAEIRYLNLSEEKVGLFQKLIKEIIYSSNKKLNFDDDLSDARLWKYGISGDYYLLTIEIYDITNFYVVEELLEAYRYLKTKNIEIELVILTNEKGYIEESLNEETKRLLNQRKGIFVIENINANEKSIIKKCSNLVINADDGELKTQQNNWVESIPKNHRNENIEDNIKFDDFKFNIKNDTVEIVENKANVSQLAWSNILANKKFGTVMTDALGGFTWYINSKTNRITCFSNDPINDNSSEKIFFECSGEKWSIDALNYPDNENYKVIYGLGYSKIEHSHKEIQQEMSVFVPVNDSAKVMIFSIKNKSNQIKNIRLMYKCDFQMTEREKNKNYLVERYKKNLNMIIVKNCKNPSNYAYITSSEKINRKKEIVLRLEPGEIKNFSVVLGCETSEMDCIDVGSKYTLNYDSEFRKTKKYWNNLVKRVTSNTKDKNFDFMQNGWLAYQTIVSRLYGKTGFYQVSGGYGFRDQLQDAIGMRYIDTNLLKNQIIRCAEHQFLEGDVTHWWHEDSNLAIRSKYSDDMLWLPFAVIKYIDFTGDYAFLNEKTTYLMGSKLEKHENDRVDKFKKTDYEESIFEHCIRAIKKSNSFGKHGLPLIYGGDWNDGMNMVGKEEKGESVWLGMFMFYVLKRFTEIIKYKYNNQEYYKITKDMEIALNNDNKPEFKTASIGTSIKRLDYVSMIDDLSNLCETLKSNINAIGWDGHWFRRAIDDNGDLIGSVECKECKIDSICQAWAVLSGIGDDYKNIEALENAENLLFDRENQIMKLLTPAFKDNRYGYIGAYNEGVRENGGQYTHSAIWMLMAEAVLKREGLVEELYKTINPLYRTKEAESLNKYKVEPFVIAADIYSNNSLKGHGGWTWYTASSSLLYEAQISYILGIKIYHGKMKFDPCIPKSWGNFNVIFKWKKAIYNLHYIKKNSNDVKTNPEVILENKGKFDVFVEY